MNKLVILDRDGVINYDSPNYIRSPEEWNPIPGSLEAIAKLTQAGYQVVVATNQSGVGRGYYNQQTLDHIHKKMQTLTSKLNGRIDGVFACPHKPDDNCECRKPKPGLFDKIAKHFQINLHQTPAIGDSLRDLSAAKTANCIPILVLTGNGKKTLEKLPPELKDIATYNTLADAVDALLSDN